jgi:hypothetical protein
MLDDVVLLFGTSACAVLSLLPGNSAPVNNPMIARTDRTVVQDFLTGCAILIFTSDDWDFDTEVYQNWINFILVIISELAGIFNNPGHKFHHSRLLIQPYPLVYFGKMVFKSA